MIKRKTALLFTLIANIILLALAVIPHHHHDGEICIINPVCHSNHENDQDNNNRHNHDHNGSDDNHFCLLEQEIVLPSNNLQNLLKAFDTVDHHTGFDSLYTILNDSEYSRYVPPDYSCAHFGIKSSLYSCFVSLSQGLRGPPTA